MCDVFVSAVGSRQSMYALIIIGSIDPSFSSQWNEFWFLICLLFGMWYVSTYIEMNRFQIIIFQRFLIEHRKLSMHLMEIAIFIISSMILNCIIVYGWEKNEKKSWQPKHDLAAWVATGHSQIFQSCVLITTTRLKKQSNQQQEEIEKKERNRV